MIKDTYYIRPCYQDPESQQPYLIHRNKHREAAKNEETKKHGPNERTGETPKKELNKIEISNLLDVEFKTMVIRMPKELSEDVSNI